MVAGDFNGAAWRRPCGSDLRLTSIIGEAFADTNISVPPLSLPLWGIRWSAVGEWADVCGFIKPPESQNEWQVRMHGAFSVPYSTLGLRKRIKVAITRCGCISLMPTFETRSRGAVQTRPAVTLGRKKEFSHLTTAHKEAGLTENKATIRAIHRSSM